MSRQSILAAILPLALLHPISAQTIGQAVRNETTLVAGKPVARTMSGGETHVYRLTLAANQFLDLVALQEGVDVVVRLVGPDGKQLAEVDGFTGDWGDEPLKFIAPAAGDYQVTVLSFNKAAKPGRYRMTLNALRPATDRDTGYIEAETLARQADALDAKGKRAEAITTAEKSLELYEKSVGPEHPDTATALNRLGYLYRSKNDFAKAEPLYLRALAIREKVLGTDHADTSLTLNNLGMMYTAKGDHAKAESFLTRAVAIREKVLGPEHSYTALSLCNLGLVLSRRREFARSEAAYERALAIREKVLGPDHPDTAQTANDLGFTYMNAGEYVKAEPLLRRAVAIYEKALGPEHATTALSLNNLGRVLFRRGDYVGAEAAYKRALAIREKVFGPEHNETLTASSNLALLYQTMGRTAAAEAIYLRILAIQERVLGTEHPSTATTLTALGMSASAKGDYTGSAAFHTRSLAIREKVLGPDHFDTTVALNNLGVTYTNAKNYAAAEPLLLRALATREKSLGLEHPETAFVLNNLGYLNFQKDDPAAAESYFLRALAVREKTLGLDHPETAATLNFLARLHALTGDHAKALAFAVRANNTKDRDFGRNLFGGSEEAKRLYLRQSARYADLTVSLHVGMMPTDPAAARAALSVILQRKARSLDAFADQVNALRKRATPEDRKLLDDLAAARTRLAELQLTDARPASKSVKAEGDRLRERIAQLETEVGQRSVEFRGRMLSPTFDDVARAIPAGVALVEYFQYVPYDAAQRTFGDPRYVAYVLTSPDVPPAFADLGPAKEINDLAKTFRTDLSEKNPDIRRSARALDAKLMQPVRALLGGRRNVLIAPDGLLNLIPFEALIDEGNAYLVENYTFGMLTTGRDLARMGLRAESRTPPLVLANPAYDLDQRPVARAETRRATNFSDLYFDPLPGTAREAAALKAVLPDAVVLTGTRADEATLKAAVAPRVLHVATHGFFLDHPPDGAKNDNPLLRSGIVLAGVNRRSSGMGEDGVLTAFEAAGLNLWGTQLVVFSACETGLGDVKSGEGVFGLRRALVLAGSETQVMSLWQVSDNATSNLMTGYYARLQAGEGRVAALRAAQLDFLGGKIRTAWRHPYYWASFVVSGDWNPLTAGSSVKKP